MRIALELATLAALVLALTWGARPAHALSISGTGNSADSPGMGAPSASPGASGAPAPNAFAIGGGVQGLYPGEHRELELYLTNPFGFAISVEQIEVSVGDAPRGCRARYLVARSFGGHLAIAPRSSVLLGLPISLRHSAPNTCEGAVFPLRYRGTATR